MILLDGIIFSLQRHGGISVYFHELLKHLDRHRVPVELAVEKPLLQPVGSGSTATVNQRTARVGERYRRCRVNERAALFHSSYYRRPSRQTCPTVVTVHDFIYERLNVGVRRWAHTTQKYAAIRAADFIICISEQTRRDLLEYVGITARQQLSVIYNGVSETFKPISGLEVAARPYILFVGQRAGYKNFALALQSLRFLPGFELHCVGGGAIRSDELSDVPADVGNRVHHLGYISDEELNLAYNRAVCLVYPSLFEGFGIPVIEAMRAGCPVIAADCAAVVEIGGAALSVLPALEPKLLAEAVMQMCEPHTRQRITTTGFDVSQQFSWAKTHTRTLATYDQLVPGSTGEGNLL